MKLGEAGDEENEPASIAGSYVKTDISDPLSYKCNDTAEWQFAVCDDGKWVPAIEEQCIGMCSPHPNKYSTIHMYLCMLGCVCEGVCECVCVCARGHCYVCVFIYKYIYIYIYIYIFTRKTKTVKVTKDISLDLFACFNSVIKSYFIQGQTLFCKSYNTDQQKTRDIYLLVGLARVTKNRSNNQL